MIPFSLIDKNILVTGASSGIGASSSIICSEQGANLILLGRNKEKLDRTMEKLKPGHHSAFSYDLMNFEGIEEVLVESLKNYRYIHGFIHAAGIDMTRPLNSLRFKDYQTVLTTNVISGFEIARILSKKRFCPSDGASFVFISSVMSIVGKPSIIAYSASKGALLSGCRSMALELASKKIRVNCISPAFVKTELIDNLFSELPQEAVEKIKSDHPLGLGSAVDIANSCVFLLSNEARWITGSNLVVDGGYSIK